MVTKCDNNQPTDNRVNIEQSASGRLEGRVLQKVNETWLRATKQGNLLLYDGEISCRGNLITNFIAAHLGVLGVAISPQRSASQISNLTSQYGKKNYEKFHIFELTCPLMTSFPWSTFSLSLVFILFCNLLLFLWWLDFSQTMSLIRV